MIKIITALNDSKIFEKNLKISLNKFKNIEFFGIENSIELDSIYKKYNFGIKSANPKDEDILIFCHEDIQILDPLFDKKLELIFKMRPDVGVVGIIGTKVLGEFGWWSNEHKHHIGHVQQGLNDGSSYHMVRKIDFDDEMCVIDGCFFAVRGKVSKRVLFLEEIYEKSYHFYDYSFCISVLELGWKVAVGDILIFHQSEGPLSDDWNKSRTIFHKYIKERGLKFPLTCKDAFMKKG